MDFYRYLLIHFLDLDPCFQQPLLNYGKTDLSCMKAQRQAGIKFLYKFYFFSYYIFIITFPFAFLSLRWAIARAPSSKLNESETSGLILPFE